MNRLLFALTISFFAIKAASQDSDFDGLEDWEEINVHGTDPTKSDTDEDGLIDGVEVNKYHTNPLRESTDGDQYDDGQEINGWSPANLGEMGGDLPGYVIPPGNNVFVSAYPIIGIKISSEISIVEISEITTEERVINIQSVGYSVGATDGSSYSVGETAGHKHEEWIDVTNVEEDRISHNAYNDDLSSEEANYYNQTSLNHENTLEANVGLGISKKKLLPATIAASAKDTIEKQEKVGEFRGMNATKTEGASISFDRIRKSVVNYKSKDEYSYSTTVTRRSYSEVTVTNIQNIANGTEWATATTVDTSRAAKLRFSFDIINSGTDVAKEINDLWFTITIGDNIPYTYPPSSEDNIGLFNLFPNQSARRTAEIEITLDELRSIDLGVPIYISVGYYSYGAEQLAFRNSFKKSVLVEIDDGVEDGDESIDYYMTYVANGDKYYDALKRLSQLIPVAGPNNLRREVDIEFQEDNIVAFNGKQLDEWNSLMIFTQELDPGVEYIRERPAVKGKRLLLVYNQDTDHDYYSDRVEQKIGTDISDPNSHPSPKLIVAKYEESGAGERRIWLKFQNIGDYDAFGIEAWLYSPDATTTVTDSIIGGGGRIEAGREFMPNDSFSYYANGDDFTDPVILVKYNDPQGPHSFICRTAISAPEEDISHLFDAMVRGAAYSTKSTVEYSYDDVNWIAVEYYNPDIPISDAKLIVVFQDYDGNAFETINRDVYIQRGLNSFVVKWRPSNTLPADSVGSEIKYCAVLADKNGTELFDDVKYFKVVEHEVFPRLISTFSNGDDSTSFIFKGGEPLSSSLLTIPEDAYVKEARLSISVPKNEEKWINPLCRDLAGDSDLLPTLSGVTTDGTFVYVLSKGADRTVRLVEYKIADLSPTGRYWDSSEIDKFECSGVEYAGGYWWFAANDNPTRILRFVTPETADGFYIPVDSENGQLRIRGITESCYPNHLYVLQSDIENHVLKIREYGLAGGLKQVIDLSAVSPGWNPWVGGITSDRSRNTIYIGGGDRELFAREIDVNSVVNNSGNSIVGPLSIKGEWKLPGFNTWFSFETLNLPSFAYNSFISVTAIASDTLCLYENKYNGIENPSLEIGSPDGQPEWSLPGAAFGDRMAYLWQFSDGAMEERISYPTSGGNSTVNIRIPKGITIEEASVSVAGYAEANWLDTSEKDSEDSSQIEGDWFNPGRCSDGNWDNYGHVISQNGLQGGILFYDYVLPEMFYDAKVHSKFQLVSNPTSVNCQCWDYKNEEWLEIFDVYGQYKKTYTLAPAVYIPGNCIREYASGSVIRTRFGVSIRGTVGNLCRVNFFDSKISWARSSIYPTNLSLDVGLIDGNPEWKAAGSFDSNQEKIEDLEGSLTSYVLEHTAGEEDAVSVPLTFRSDSAGGLEVFDVNVVYIDVNDTPDIAKALNQSLSGDLCHCIGCQGEGGLCDIPFTFNAAGGGYVIMSDLRVYYTYRHSIEISSTSGGSVVWPGLGLYEYEYGEEVEISANPEEGYIFVRWSGSAVDANVVSDPLSPQTTFRVDGDYSIVANFAVSREFIRGDVNSDTSVDISDCITILLYLFSDGAELPCLKAANTNGDSVCDISDAVFLLEFLFKGSSPLPEPTEECGFDSVFDELPCMKYLPCE